LERAQQTLQHVATPAGSDLLARIRYLQGDLGAAQAAGLRRAHTEPGDVASLTLLAHIALDRGKNSLGMSYLRRALQRDPFDAEATQLLDNLEAREP
jgi:hypothetical protein